MSRKVGGGKGMKRTVLLLPILSGILFGSSGVFVRELGAHALDSATILFLRTLFAALILAAVLLVRDRRLFRVRWGDLPLFLGTGLLGMLGLNLCYNVALDRLSLSLAAVLLSTAPVFVMLLAALIFRERVTGRKAVCVLLAILGCVLASGALEQGGGSLSPAGVAAGLAAAVFYALYSIFSKQATGRGYHTYTVIFYSVLFITLALLPFAGYGAISAFVAEAPGPGLLFLFVHALCTSVLPYVLLTLALRHAEAGKVSILASGGEPAAALVFGLLVYSEIPSPWMVLGLVVTVAALALLCAAPERER